jgi:predicted component of type VI protein secretion system
MSDRLKASELLGRSECDFSDRKIVGLDRDGFNELLSFFPPKKAKKIKQRLKERLIEKYRESQR